MVLNDAIQLVERLLGRKAVIENRPQQTADVMATWADIRKAQGLLGWRPKIHFQEGVSRLVSWYEENREWVKGVETG